MGNNISARDFLKSLSNFSDTCNSCKFFNPSTGLCREKDIEVNHKDAKCDKWRYGC